MVPKSKCSTGAWGQGSAHPSHPSRYCEDGSRVLSGHLRRQRQDRTREAKPHALRGGGSHLAGKSLVHKPKPSHGVALPRGKLLLNVNPPASLGKVILILMSGQQ